MALEVGGMDVSQARQLKAIEDEKHKLKKEPTFHLANALPVWVGLGRHGRAESILGAGSIGKGVRGGEQIVRTWVVGIIGRIIESDNGRPPHNTS
jgi:hypothetical protein